jgi:hypothetical protein
MRREEILMKAAGKLHELAADIERTHTVRGEWVLNDAADFRAKQDYDECIQLAGGLMVMAKST